MRTPFLTVLLASLALALPASAQRRSGSSRGSGEGRGKVTAPRASTRSPRLGAPRTKSLARSHPRATTPATPGARDTHGRLKRSESAKDQFLRQTGHPHGWPGHVVDHRIPLACGGADAPSNMQWQTTEEAKAKDRIERQGCARSR
jgi:hypothetical protein